jgi:hypothetical protein
MFGKDGLPENPSQKDPKKPTRSLSHLTIDKIAEGTYLDLKDAFIRCTKKYSYTQCVKFTQGMVAVKCKYAPIELSESLFTQKCVIRAFKKVNMNRDFEIGDGNGN